jgi:O-antigen ligase
LSLISTGSFDNGRFLKYYFLIFSGLFIINALYNPVMFGKVVERMSTLENLGSQGIGLYASILFVWSTTLFITLNNVTGKVILMFIILISIFYLAVSATRSVFSGAILVTILFIIQNRKKFLKQYFFALALFIGVLISTISFWGRWLNLTLTRLQSGIESGTTGRQNIWPQAVEMFNSSPLWGNYHIIPDRTYFHNFFLDAFVSTGLIGGLIFTVLNIKIITICLRWLKLESKPEYRFYSIGFLLVFIFGMFSQALYSTSFYWGFLMLIIVFSAQENIYNIKRYEINYQR